MPTTYRPYRKLQIVCSTVLDSPGQLKDDTYSYRSGTVKRPKPVGVERYFKPTARSVTRQQAFDRLHGYPLVIQPCKRSVIQVMSQYDAAGFGRPTASAPLTMTTAPILKKIKDEKVALGMLLAEYRQTAVMFADLGKRIWGVYRALRTGDWMHAPSQIRNLWRQLQRRGLGPYQHKLHRAGKGVSDDYLMYRFGVDPLIGDLEDILDTLALGLGRPLIRRVTAGRRVKDWVLRDLSYNYFPVGKEIQARTSSYKDVVWVEYEPESLSSNLTQLGLANPPQLAWELIPFSFLVDRFISIGDVLASLDALKGVKRYAYTRRWRGSVRSYWPNGSVGMFDNYDRTVEALTLPPLRWQPSTSWKYFADSVALMRQRMR